MINRALLPILFLAALIFAVPSASAYEIVGQPSIFWRDGEWQVYKDGHWVPYAGSTLPQAQPVQAEPVYIPVPAPEAPITDTNAYYPDDGYGYGYSYGFPLWNSGGHRHINRNATHRRSIRTHPPVDLNNRSIGNIGRTTIGIGQPTIGIGQPTIGIGQQSGTIGHQFR